MSTPENFDVLDPDSLDFDAGVATDVYGAIAKHLGQDEVTLDEAIDFIENNPKVNVGFSPPSAEDDFGNDGGDSDEEDEEE